MRLTDCVFCFRLGTFGYFPTFFSLYARIEKQLSRSKWELSSRKNWLKSGKPRVFHRVFVRLRCNQCVKERIKGRFKGLQCNAQIRIIGNVSTLDMDIPWTIKTIADVYKIIASLDFRAEKKVCFVYGFFSQALARITLTVDSINGCQKAAAPFLRTALVSIARICGKLLFLQCHDFIDM